MNISSEFGTVVTTQQGEGATSKTAIALTSISPCTHEEADTRLFLHALEYHGKSQMLIRTVDLMSWF